MDWYIILAEVIDCNYLELFRSNEFQMVLWIMSILSVYIQCVHVCEAVCSCVHYAP